jgi:hypothetical protein
LRRAYVAIAAVVVAFILFAVFVPFIVEGTLSPCPMGMGCTPIMVTATVSPTCHLFRFGGMILGNSYHFVTSGNYVF